MPRIVAGRSLEIHFQSPHEMIEFLGKSPEGEGLLLPTTQVLAAGDERDLHMHVPWLGRRLHLRIRVLRAASADEPPGILVRIHDGPRDTLEQLVEIVGRFRTGAVLEEPAGDEPPEQRIRSMSPSLRAMLAMKAGPEERLILARDPDPRVLEFLLKNPSMGTDEVRRLATKLTLHHGHFALILRNSAWMADEPLRMALARNPRLPEFMAETVLQTLTTPALKNLVESMNTTAATRRVASRVLQARGIVVSTRRGAM